MTQQFKFGDQVYFPSNVEEIGVVIQVLNSKNKIVVAWNDGEQTTEAIDDVQLTIIPHPDTARLDYIQKNFSEIRVCEDERFFTLREDGENWLKIGLVNVRELIDMAIAEQSE